MDDAKWLKVVKKLIAVGAEKIDHDYFSGCPDPSAGMDVRGEKCPACRCIIEAKQLVKEVKSK